ncbi:MAG: calcium/sodium antiporter [candidate division Zixibacteria bacterium]|jgi:cation:H+ antiporter|nr:calcium/sodium antiporter [candidate division Zixibacteria bacterium]
MLMIIIYILSGGVLLYFGGEWLVSGSSSFALRRGVSKLIIGLTIVAFGTSAPELFISSVAAFKGSASISIGNIIGSNIANIGLILGFSALIFPPQVSAVSIKFQVPFAIGVAILLLLLSLNSLIGPIDSLVFLAGFVFFNLYCVKKSREGVIKVETEVSGVLRSRFHDYLFVILGLLALPAGSELFVRGAIDLARLIGVSEFMIGLSLVALGTSLPELATSIVAAVRKESDIVVGNVIGSCIFNILLVMGVVGLIKPVRVPTESLYIDIPLMIVITIALYPMFSSGRKVSRLEGVMLLSVYVGYIVFVALRG